MKRKVRELKRIARGNLSGNYMILIKAYVLVTGIAMLVELPFSMLQTPELLSTQNTIYFVAQILINILAIILICGQYKMQLSLARTGKIKETDLFEPVKKQPDRYILANFILFGLSLLAMIPSLAGLAMLYFYEGITVAALAFALCLLSTILSTYVSLTYNLVFFVLLDNPNMSVMEALKATKQMMVTHRKRYLYMQFSFLGMMLAVGLSFGIGILWVEPYMTQTTTLFYLDTKGELDAIQTERRKSAPIPEPTVINHYV